MSAGADDRAPTDPMTYASSDPDELEGNTAVAVFKALQHAYPCR
jgi:hypothetical protein